MLLLIPDAGGRGKGVLSGKVFEYIAAQRPILALVPPDGAAADLIRETGAGVVAPPDDVDAIRDALVELDRRFRSSGLPDVQLSEEWRRRLARETRVEETAELLRSLSEATVLSRRQPVVDALFFATVFTVTFAKIHWDVGADLSLSDVLTILFLIAFALGRIERLDGRFARSAAITFGFFVAFLAVYLLGFFNLETATALAQWAKGMFKFMLHFLFLFAAVALVARRSQRFYWWTLAAFCGGLVFNALYGVLQLGVAQGTGGNLDAALLAPITGGASQINIYGAIEGANVYRPNALTGDPNHLGIELVIPILILLPDLPSAGARPSAPGAADADADVPLRDGARDAVAQRHARPLRAACSCSLFRIGTCSSRLGSCSLSSRSGSGSSSSSPHRADFFQTVLRSRVDTSGKGTSTHFVVYEFIPQVLSQHPLFGLGLNNFSVYYEFVTGRNNFGPHSFYVALFVETGIIGALLFLAFLGYLFQRLAVGRAIGRALAEAGEGLAARVRPLEWGLTAALVATMASNFFYLTMSFYYFFVFAMLVIAAPAVFGRRLIPA